MYKNVLIVTWSAIILALLSYFTTVRTGELDWPAAFLQIRVVDAANLPIEGAQLSVFRGTTAVPEFQEANCCSSNYTSNKDGTIDLLVRPMRWTSTSWRLFWVIPVRPSNYLAQFDAHGFQPGIEPILVLLDDAGLKGKRRVNEVEGEAAKGLLHEEIGVYHATIILRE